MRAPAPQPAVEALLCGPDGAPAVRLDDADAAIDACETTGDGVTVPGTSGVGGLCHMSPGFVTDPWSLDCQPAAWTGDGRSNGQYDPYDGFGSCLPASTPRPAILLVTRDWHEIRMDGIPFRAAIGGIACGHTGLWVIYDQQFAYTVGEGHVAGAAVPLAGPFLGWYASYSVQPSPGPDLATDRPCSGSAPFYQ